MLLARVVGTVVATRKDPRLVSNKLLIARPMDPHGKPEGNYLVAVDTVDAGVGETVLIVSGSSARMAAGMKDCPVDAAIVGIVDTIEVDGRRLTLTSSHAARARHRRRRGHPEGREPRRRDAARAAAAGADGTAAGRTLVAVDAVGAGVGETVFFVRGKEASFPFHPGRSAGRRRRRRHRGPLGRRSRTASMQLARVVGTVVATQKHREFEGAKLLLVQPVDARRQPRGAALLAVDSVGAGVHRARADRARGARRRRGAGPQGRAGGRGRSSASWTAWTCTNDRAGTARAGARRHRAPRAACGRPEPRADAGRRPRRVAVCART